jgi:lambda family phage tail tape measure protein
MATIDNYTININVKGDQDLKAATQSVNNLGKSVNDASSTAMKNFSTAMAEASNESKNFGEKIIGLKENAEKLALAIVGVGLLEYIHKVAEGAAQTKDLSEAFGLQISTVLELQAGFQRAGRDAGDMTKMMTSLNQKALEVADGNLKVKNAFEDLGVTFTDLKTLSMDQIMLKIGKAMEESKGSAESIAAAMEVLGKGAKGVPWGDFVEGLERAQGKMDQASQGVLAFDTAMKKMEQTTADIRREFMIIITPVVEFFNKMTEGSNNAKLAAEALAGAMAVFAGGAIYTGIKALVGVVTSLVPAFGATAIATGVATEATGVLTAAELAYLRVQQASTVARAESLAASIAQARATLAETVAIEGDVVATAELTAAKRVLMITSGQLAAAQGAAAGATAGLAVGEAAVATGSVAATAGVTSLTAASTGLGVAIARFLPYLTIAAGAIALLYSSDLNKGEDDQIKEIHKLQDAISSLPKAQQEAYFKMSDAEKKRVADAVKNGQAIKDAMAGVVGPGKTGDQSVLDPNKKQLNQQAAAEASLQSQYAIQKLTTEQQEKRLKFQAEIIGLGEVEKTQKMAAFDSEQKQQQDIFKLREDIRKMEIQAANDPEGAAKYAGQLKIMRQQLEVVTNQKSQTAELTTQLKIAEQTQQKILFGRQLEYKAVDEIAKLQDEINGLTLTTDQQKFASIQRVIEAETKQEIRRREALLGNNETLGFQEQIDILNQVAKAYDPIIQKQKELTEMSRQFSTGWDAAFNQYVSDSTNAAKKGGEAFNIVTNNMNTSIDNFVTTGKFSFEDFTRSILQDLIKIELKAQASQLIRGLFGGGGVLGFLGDIFRAEGGPVAGNKPYIVGEKGPELFVPQGAGSIVPNGATIGGGGGGGGATTNVTNNYNVSAIDSKSVAQFFAEHRKTMLGTVQLAQKELPYGNR